jgi:hypothetical protein
MFSWSNVFNLLKLLLQLLMGNCPGFSQFSIVPSKSDLFLLHVWLVGRNDDA